MEALVKEYGISPAALDALTKRARPDFDDDEMMEELHVLRTIRGMRFDEERRSVHA